MTDARSPVVRSVASGGEVVEGHSVNGRRCVVLPDPGLGSLIPALAAAFLGAPCLQPDRYNVAGTAIAVYVIGVGISSLQQMGADIFIYAVFNGAELLTALIISTIVRRRRIAR